MEIDLKDGFFRISMDEKLSRLSGFTYGNKSCQWNRLPQGWKWNIILFCECMAEIIREISSLQYTNNIVIGEESLEELRAIAHQGFAYFDEYGIQVDFDEVKWVSEEFKFCSLK